jgi:hypothetical protein
MSSAAHTTTSQKSSFSPTVSSTSLPSRPFAPPIQAKLTVGEPNDQYEQEADRVAESVVAQLQTMGDAGGANANGNNRDDPLNQLQRKPLIGSLLQKLAIQRDSAEEDEIMMKSEQGENASASDAIESAINQKKGGGSALPDIFRSKVEQAIGADFSGVRVHTDQDSDTLNRSLSARAFTTGNDIFFKQGEYNPSSTEGQKLITHELTHTIQQNGYVQAKHSNITVQRLIYQDDQPVNFPGVYAGQPEEEPIFYNTDDTNYSGYGGNPTPVGQYGQEQPVNFPGVYAGQPEEEPIFYNTDDTNHSIYGNAPQGQTGVAPNDNRVPAYKYKKINQRAAHYEGEDKDSRDITHVNDIFKALEKQVADGKIPSVAEGLKKSFGWSDEDVEKYYTNKEKSQVKYLDKDARKQYELIGGSPIMQGEPPTPFDTSQMFSKHSGNGFGIYVMSPNGELYSHAHKVGLFHHSSFLEGLPTAGAGEIKVEGGSIKHITNKSGHYLPDKQNMVQVLEELVSRGVNLSGIKVSLVGGAEYDSAQEFMDQHKT